MFKFMKFQSFILSDTLYTVLHNPWLTNHYNLTFTGYTTSFLVHPILKKLFKHSTQEEYLAIRSDSQYILFPLSANIMACQVSNEQFSHIKSHLYVADTSKS